MFYVDSKTPEQLERWEAAMDGLRALEEEAREGDDPWFFHGTSAINAAWIRRDGFRPSHLLIQPEEGNVRPDDPRSADGVNWGTLNVAQWAAERKGTYDDPPVIIAARLSSLRKAGELVPDHFAWHTSCCHKGSGRPYDACDLPEGPLPADPDWRECLLVSGAFGVVGCARVEGLVVHDPLRTVAVHPDWQEARDRRIAARHEYRPVPPRGMREPTPRSHPPTIGSKEAFEAAYARQWDRAPAARPEAPAPAM